MYFVLPRIFIPTSNLPFFSRRSPTWNRVSRWCMSDWEAACFGITTKATKKSRSWNRNPVWWTRRSIRTKTTDMISRFFITPTASVWKSFTVCATARVYGVSQSRAVSIFRTARNIFRCFRQSADGVWTPSNRELERQLRTELQSGKKRNRTKVTNAYQIRGTRFSTENGIGVINGKIDASRFAASAKEHGATVTQYLAALLTYAIWQSDGFAKTSKRPINICIPVNLRKYFNSHSLRNFSLIFHTSTQCGGKKLTFDDILETIKQDFREELTLDKLQEMLNANVSIEKTLAPFPLFLKKIGIRIGTSLLGDKIKTCTISNLGKIDLPAELNDKIKISTSAAVGNGSTPQCHLATTTTAWPCPSPAEFTKPKSNESFSLGFELEFPGNTEQSHWTIA